MWRSQRSIVTGREPTDAQQAIRHLSVFALTRIPFLVAIGYHHDDKIPTTVFGPRRDGTGDAGWGFDPDA